MARAPFDSTQISQSFGIKNTQSLDTANRAQRFFYTKLYRQEKTFDYKFKAPQIIIPAVLLAYGTVAACSNTLKDFSKTINSDLHPNGVHPFTIDNYTQYVPVVGVYALNLAGVKGAHNYLDLTLITGTSYVIAGILTEGLKHAVGEMRPDMSDRLSFPSGHTVVAFTGAEIVWQEYKGVSVWYGISAYAIAAGTGFLRMYNDKHWFHDVVMGAGIGIVSTKIAYWSFPLEDRIFKKIFKIKDNSLIKSTSVIPYYNGSQYGAGVAFEL
jgi:membrane-associated phospholipid phosphatase